MPRYLRRQVEDRAAKRLHHGLRYQRGDGHRRERNQSIGTDNQFECVEGAGQRSIECPGDRRRGAAPDQQPQIVAPDPECMSPAGRNRRSDLSIASFQPDRRADAIRQNRLQHDDQATVQ